MKTGARAARAQSGCRDHPRHEHDDLGNHSGDAALDFYNAKIDNRPADRAIGDEQWLKEAFISAVQQRGAAVIKARGVSSAGSARNAIVDTVGLLINDTPRERIWHSVAVCSDGELRH